MDMWKKYAAAACVALTLYAPVAAEAHWLSSAQEKEIGTQAANDFAKEYPYLANRGRAVHTYEDTEYNTSYETYLRGELLTYSPKMLVLYAEFIKRLQKKGLNLSKFIMSFTTSLYGYASLEAAESKLKYSAAAKEMTEKILSNMGGFQRIG